MKHKSTIIFVSIFSAILFLFWLLFYSYLLANNKQIILLRNMYIYKLGLILPKNKLLYTIRPIGVDDSGIYTYKLTGKITNIDYKDLVMVIRDMYGRNWKVKLDVVDKLNSGIIKIRYAEEGKIKYFLANSNDPIALNGYLQQNDIVVVSWQNKRKVSAIKRNQLIEVSENKVIPITKLTNEN